MIYVNAVGLGKSKLLKKIQIKKVGKALKKVSIKNAVKVVKFAAPIAAGFIPLGGGVAGKLTSKLVNSKAGKVVGKLNKSKVGRALKKVRLSKVGSLVAAKAKTAASNKIESITSENQGLDNEEAPEDNSIAARTNPSSQAINSPQAARTNPSSQAINSPQAATPKSNTMMYVGGAVVLAGIAYLATKKK